MLLTHVTYTGIKKWFCQVHVHHNQMRIQKRSSVQHVLRYLHMHTTIKYGSGCGKHWVATVCTGSVRGGVQQEAGAEGH